MDVPVSARENDPLLYGYRQDTVSADPIQEGSTRQHAVGCGGSGARGDQSRSLAYLSSARGQHAGFLCLAESEKLAVSLIGIWDWALRILRSTEGTLITTR